MNIHNLVSIFPEVGFTPNNLKKYMEITGRNIQEIADITESSYSTVQSWLLQVETNRHRGMPSKKWAMLMKEKSLSVYDLDLPVRTARKIASFLLEKEVQTNQDQMCCPLSLLLKKREELEKTLSPKERAHLNTALLDLGYE